MGHNRLKKLKGYGILKSDRNIEHFYLVYCYPYSQMFLNGWLQSMLLRCLVIRFLTLVASASQGRRDKHRINFFPSQLSQYSFLTKVPRRVSTGIVGVPAAASVSWRIIAVPSVKRK